jgi:hypothetical protein
VVFGDLVRRLEMDQDPAVPGGVGAVPDECPLPGDEFFEGGLSGESWICIYWKFR